MPLQPNRRDFLKTGGAGLLSLLFLPRLSGKVAASDRLRVAHVGLGGMGTQHLKWFAGLPEVEVAALCDLDETQLAKALQTYQSLQPNAKVDTYSDFRRILDRSDIDAITCATPDHWHANVAIMAFQAGKDVYGEKPLSYDLREGQRMLQAQERYQRVFQLGTQIHAGDNYHRVVELLRSGAIGEIHTVRLWKTGGPPELQPSRPQKPPKTLDWNQWLGPAPRVPYQPERCHFTYRYFLDYSGGVFADFWCHIADIVFWAIEPKGLRSIQSRGERASAFVDTPKWIEVDYAFDGLNLYWTTEPPNVPGAANRGIGAYFEGSKGTLLCDYSSRQLIIDGETLTDLPNVPQSVKRSPGHQQNFVDAVKSRSQPESNMAYARRMTLPMHLGLISYRLGGRKLQWDEGKELFVGDEEANGMLERKGRKRWVMG